MFFMVRPFGEGAAWRSAERAKCEVHELQQRQCENVIEAVSVA